MTPRISEVRRRIRWWHAALCVLAIVCVGVMATRDSDSEGGLSWYLEAPTLEDGTYTLQLSEGQRKECVVVSYSIVESHWPDYAGYLGASAFNVRVSVSSNDAGDVSPYAWTTVDLGSSVSFVGGGAFLGHKLQAYGVDDQNQWYHAANGFLVGSDGTLVAAPDGLSGALVVPDGVTGLQSGSLGMYKTRQAGDSVQLVDVFLPASVNKIDDDALPTYVKVDEVSAVRNQQVCGACLHVPRGSWAESYAQKNDVAYDNLLSPDVLEWSPVEVAQHKAKLTFRRYGDHAALVGIKAAYAGHVEIPASVEGVPVTVIGADSDDVASGVVKTLIIPKDVSMITEGALLANLRSVRKFEVDAENASYTVRDGSICSADGKTLIVYPQGRGESYEVPSGVEAIAAQAFYGAELTSVVLPEGLTRIGKQAFYGCSALTDVNVPSTLEYIGPDAFGGIPQLCVQLNEGLTTISDGSFNGAESFKTLDISDSVRRIGRHAFAHSRDDDRVTVESRVIRIGSGLEQLADGAFDGLDFDSFEVSPENEHFKVVGPFLLSKDGKTLHACASTVGSEAHVPDGVEELRAYALSDIPDLTDLYLPDSLYRMGSLCFGGDRRDAVTLHCPAGSEAARIAQAEGF